MSDLTFGGEISFFAERDGCSTFGFHTPEKRELGVKLAESLAMRVSGKMTVWPAGDDRYRRQPYASVEAPTKQDGFIQFAVRPDVDVLEINLPVSTSQGDLENHISTVFDCANELGLRSNRTSQLRNVGSRGGFHLTVGVSRKLADWQHRTIELAIILLELFHENPALSYLFAGDQLGPAGFHPRLDEACTDYRARLDAIRSIAATLSASNSAADFAFASELLCDLVTDRWGGAHNVELCFDKLVSPDPQRDLGIIEVRSFEMFETAFEMRQLVAVFQAVLCKALKRQAKQKRLGETTNPDLWDAELCAMLSCADYGPSSLESSIKALSRIRYPPLAHFPIGSRALRLRVGRTQTFSRRGGDHAGASQFQFLPWKISYGLLFDGDDHSTPCHLTLHVDWSLDWAQFARASMRDELSRDQILSNLHAEVVNVVDGAANEVGLSEGFSNIEIANEFALLLPRQVAFDARETKVVAVLTFDIVLRD